MVRPSRLFVPKQGNLEVMGTILTRFESRVSKRLIHDAARAAFTRLTETGTTARRTNRGYPEDRPEEPGSKSGPHLHQHRDRSTPHTRQPEAEMAATSAKIKHPLSG